VVAQVKSGDKVKVHYTGKLEDGTVFDSSRKEEPAEFTVGQKQVIGGLDEAVVGMAPGETKTAKIPPAKAFGERDESRVVQVARIDLPEGLEPQIGQVLRSRRSDGRTDLVKVTKVGDEKVTIDANHPLAGHEVTLEVELVAIE
jgi:peptidylprolyl isomerase